MDKKYLLQVITDCEMEKRQKDVEPHYATREKIMEHIYADMRSCLNELLQEKKIEYHRTLNSWAVNVK